MHERVSPSKNKLSFDKDHWIPCYKKITTRTTLLLKKYAKSRIRSRNPLWISISINNVHNTIIIIIIISYDDDDDAASLIWRKKMLSSANKKVNGMMKMKERVQVVSAEQHVSAPLMILPWTILLCKCSLTIISDIPPILLYCLGRWHRIQTPVASHPGKLTHYQANNTNELPSWSRKLHMYLPNRCWRWWISLSIRSSFNGRNIAGT